MVALGPISLLSNGTGGYFSGGEPASALVLEASYSLQLVPKLRKSGTVYSTPIHVFTACVGKRLGYCSTFEKHGILIRGSYNA